MNTPPPLGTIGVTPTYANDLGGFMGWAIRTFTGRSIKGPDRSPVNHAVVYVGRVEGFEKPQLVQAQPGGADLAAWDSYGDDMIWLTDMWTADREDNDLVPLVPTAAQRNQIVAAALTLAACKIGYSFLDYVAIILSLKTLGAPLDSYKPTFWARVLGNNRRMICSQLADFTWHTAGLEIFKGRLYGLVTPNDLYLAGGAPKHPNHHTPVV